MDCVHSLNSVYCMDTHEDLWKGEVQEWVAFGVGIDPLSARWVFVDILNRHRSPFYVAIAMVLLVPLRWQRF